MTSPGQVVTVGEEVMRELFGARAKEAQSKDAQPKAPPANSAPAPTQAKDAPAKDTEEKAAQSATGARDETRAHE